MISMVWLPASKIAFIGDHNGFGEPEPMSIPESLRAEEVPAALGPGSSRTCGSPTTGYDIATLQSERDRLDATTQDLLTNIQRLGSGPAIRKEALDAGLTPLAAPIVVPAR